MTSLHHVIILVMVMWLHRGIFKSSIGVEYFWNAFEFFIIHKNIQTGNHKICDHLLFISRSKKGNRMKYIQISIKMKAIKDYVKHKDVRIVYFVPQGIHSNVQISIFEVIWISANLMWQMCIKSKNCLSPCFSIKINKILIII